jgi:hypothetical protein
MRKRGGILDTESLSHYRSPNSVVNAVAKRRHATDHILLYLRCDTDCYVDIHIINVLLAHIIFDSFFFSSLRLNTLANLNTALTTRDEDELDQDLVSIRKVP